MFVLSGASNKMPLKMERFCSYPLKGSKIYNKTGENDSRQCFKVHFNLFIILMISKKGPDRNSKAKKKV